MLVIRFRPIGKKNQPIFRIVVTEKKNSPRAGRRVERLGFYNPLTKEFSVKKERVLYWLSKGAKCSDTVHNLLLKKKVIEGKKIDVRKKSKKQQEPPVVKVTTGEPKPVEKPKAPEAPRPVEVLKPEETKPVEKIEKKPAEKQAEKKEEKPVEKIEPKPAEEKK